MSTNRGSYPQGGRPYPQWRPVFHAAWAAYRLGRSVSVGVQQLPEGPDVTSEVVVLSHLSLDLFAAVQHRGMVSATKRFADPKERCLGLFAHQVHRDLAREHDLPVACLSLDLVEWN